MMYFPTPDHSHSRTSSTDEGAADPFQWQKFDRLFDQVFGPAKPAPVTPEASLAMTRQIARSNMPGGFARGRVIAQGDETNPISGDEEDFDKLWNDTLRRTKKTNTTTTKRRIIRHTPAMDMPVPSLPSENSHSQTDAYRSTSIPEPSTPPRRTGVLDHAFSSPEDSPSSSSGSSSSGSPAPSLRHQKSKFNFQDHVDTNFITATFEMPEGLTRNDIHVSYSTSYGAERVTVSWQNATITEFIEAGKLVRERKERKYARTLPLPVGTKFAQVHASMQNGVLAITYPRSPLNPTEFVKPLRIV